MSQPDLRKYLSERPRLLRTSIARGAKAVDARGGDMGAGLIRGMAIITRGEALGHDLWIDGAMLQDTADAINSSPNGAKARFTHPSLSGDGLGKFTGRVKNASVEGDVVRGDLHFDQTAHDTPDGDLAGYLMRLAISDPEAFGNSIAFREDFDAEELFVLQHGGDEFMSPDAANKKNLPHARMKELRAVDVVDEPAANPTGMFHRGQEIAQEADALLSYSLGLTKERPTLTALEYDPDRVTGFITRFLDRHGLAISQKEKGSEMPNPTLNATATEEAPATTKPAEGQAKPEEKPAEQPAATAPAPAATPAPTQASAAPATVDLKADGKRFLDAFGDLGGRWFAEGKTFAEAQTAYCEHLKAENKALSDKNSDLEKRVPARGEATPLSSGTPETAKPSQKDQNLGPNLARFAKGIKLPGQPSAN